GDPAAGEGAEGRADQQHRGDRRLLRRRQLEGPLNEQQRPGNDAGVVAEEKAAEGRDHRDGDGAAGAVGGSCIVHVGNHATPRARTTRRRTRGRRCTLGSWTPRRTASANASSPNCTSPPTSTPPPKWRRA